VTGGKLPTYRNITNESFILGGMGFGRADETFIPGEYLDVPELIEDARLERMDDGDQ